MKSNDQKRKSIGGSNRMGKVQSSEDTECGMRNDVMDMDKTIRKKEDVTG